MQLHGMRDEEALNRFEVFLFTAVATVLVVRSALAVTGYPQVGGNGLHIAHVLWGGLLMAVAIVVVMIFPGSRARIRAAFVGGIGFGLFIDEVGKFLTKDVDYFFKPAIAIIYATFVGFYVIVRVLIRLRPLTDRRRLALASAALSDLALGQLDHVQRDHALALLRGIGDSGDHKEMAALVGRALHAGVPARPGPEAWLTRQRDRAETTLERLLSASVVRDLVLVLCIIEAVDVVVNVILSFSRPGQATLTRTFLDTGVPSAVSGALIVAGAVLVISRRRRWGIELLEWAVLVELLFTQVVVFNRAEWLGLIGFAIALIVLVVLRLAQRALAGDQSDDDGHGAASQQGEEGEVTSSAPTTVVRTDR
ncbi:MAG: hypothetical protein JO147_10270 [Actinobacteria bacterium]|nr:hypothetical protein [Actinomycetota bacterium]